MGVWILTVELDSILYISLLPSVDSVIRWLVEHGEDPA